MQVVKRGVISVMLLALSACSSYQLGHGDRKFPGGYDRIAIPIFKNRTPEINIETYFTQSLRLEFERSELAQVTSKDGAQVIIEGIIGTISYRPTVQTDDTKEEIGSPIVTADNVSPLPKDTAFNQAYGVDVGVTIIARKVSDNKILWRSSFTKTRTFQAALLGAPGVSNSGPIYNQDIREITIAAIADDMMSEAHDRMTENF